MINVEVGSITISSTRSAQILFKIIGSDENGARNNQISIVKAFLRRSFQIQVRTKTYLKGG